MDQLDFGKRLGKAVASANETDTDIAWRQEQAVHFEAIKEKLSTESIRRVFLGDAVLANASLNLNEVLVSPVTLLSAESAEPRSVYIINNNDIYRTGLDHYIKLYLSSPQAIFVLWDWDNHHDVRRSMVLSVFSDFYVPAHFDFYSQFAAVSDSVSVPVWAGTNQWTLDFLKKNKNRILNIERLEDPLGQHISYPRHRFPRRAEYLSRLNQFFSEVGPTTAGYHELSAQERLVKWCAHMAHWVLPVRNDVPIRIFDALITGGVPIVPRTLQHHPALARFRDHLEFYGPMDIEDPRPITDAAVRKFKRGGLNGISTRIELAFAHCHVDHRLYEILGRLDDQFGCRFWPADHPSTGSG